VDETQVQRTVNRNKAEQIEWSEADENEPYYVENRGKKDQPEIIHEDHGRIACAFYRWADARQFDINKRHCGYTCR